ncbi:hypothetical protein DBV33_02360 [Pseudomonas fluorescens]|nr:hypothetical protein DBV33_02360 [Pseudomonas fluorescens]
MTEKSDFPYLKLRFGLQQSTFSTTDTSVRNIAEPCGSWLASDGDFSVTLNAGCAALIAGKPAPTGIASADQKSQAIKNGPLPLGRGPFSGEPQLISITCSDGNPSRPLQSAEPCRRSAGPSG